MFITLNTPRNLQSRLPFNQHSMNKAPSLGRQSSPGYLRNPGLGNPWPPSKTTSTSSPQSSEDLEDTRPEIPDTNSSTPFSGDPGQHRMVVAIDYGTTFSGKREGTWGYI